MLNVKEKLIELKNAVASGEMAVEGLQKALTQLLLSSELPNAEKAAKKFDNDLELVIYTLEPSNQIEAALKVIDEVMTYLEKGGREQSSG